MRYRVAVLIGIALFVGVPAAPVTASPTQDTESTRAIEGAFGLPAGDVDLSAYAQSYAIEEDGVRRIVAAVTIFVDGASTLECFASDDSATVAIADDLSQGTYRAAYEGTCFDFATEESVPFVATLTVEALATGLLRTRAGSYATHDGKRCVSQIRWRAASATGVLQLEIPDRGISAGGDVADEFSEIRSFEQRCYRTGQSL